MVNRPYICGQCGRSFIEQKYLERHKLKHVGQEIVHQCFVCDRKFDRASRLQQHSKTLIGGLPCKCCICGKEYDTIGGLENHATVHRKDKLHGKKHISYKCILCSALFPTPDDKKKHMSVMHTSLALPQRSKKGICRVCGKRVTYLEKHKSAHGLREASVCFVCGKEFKNASQLVWHSKTLIYDTPYSCCICGKKFCDTTTLEHHGFLHRNGRLFKCPQCGAQFKNSPDFNKHVSKHEEKKPFACMFCSKRYFTVGTLKMHINGKHAKRWSYSCSLCGLRFETQGRLEAHLSTHMDLFTCSLCGEGFRCQNDLKKHMYAHREERHDTICIPGERQTKGSAKGFSCSQCGEEFSCRKSLSEHAFIHASEKHGQHLNKQDGIRKESPLFTDCHFCVEGFLSY